MTSKKIIKRGDDFILLKQDGYGWNRNGRRYDARGLRSYIINSMNETFNLEDLTGEDYLLVSQMLDE